MLGIDFTQILLHLFNVALLFGGFYFLLYGPVKKFMQQREDQYAKIDADTRSNLAKAEETLASYEDKMKNADDEIAAKKQAAEEELYEQQRASREEAEAQAAQIISDACADAERQRAAIIAGAKDDILHVIEETTEKVVLEGAGEDVFEAFLAEAERSVANAGEG